jgi:hypothetical protein
MGYGLWLRITYGYAAISKPTYQHQPHLASINYKEFK